MNPSLSFSSAPSFVDSQLGIYLRTQKHLQPMLENKKINEELILGLE